MLVALNQEDYDKALVHLLWLREGLKNDRRLPAYIKSREGMKLARLYSRLENAAAIASSCGIRPKTAPSPTRKKISGAACNSAGRSDIADNNIKTTSL